jgi:hypothetical protein
LIRCVLANVVCGKIVRMIRVAMTRADGVSGIRSVQPMLTSWARRSEDLTFDKTDEKDAVVIARLTAELRCYVPEPVDQTWGRLRHLGARREQLLVEAGRQVQQMRALLECVWPAALLTARQPFRSSTWTAAMSIVVGRDGGDLARRANPVYAARFTHLTTREAEQAHRHPSPGRDRRSDPAATARRHHHRPSLGLGHRHPRRRTSRGDACRRLRSAGGPSSWVGASPTRH